MSEVKDIIKKFEDLEEVLKNSKINYTKISSLKNQLLSYNKELEKQIQPTISKKDDFQNKKITL